MTLSRTVPGIAFALAFGLSLALAGPPESAAQPASIGATGTTAASGALGPERARQALGLNPYDPAPAVSIETTTGTLLLGEGMPADESYILLLKSPYSGWGADLWDSSLDALLAGSPEDVNYVFLSYAESQDAVDADIAALRERAEAAIERLPTEEAKAHWREHLHYGARNPMENQDELPQLLMDWGSTVVTASAEWSGEAGQESLTLDATTDSGWARSLSDTGTISALLGWYGLACNDGDGKPSPPAQEVVERIALVERGTCPFTEKVANAEANGAVAALLFTDDRDKTTMAGECDPCPDIPAAMIDRPPGLQLRDLLEAGTPVTATLSPTPIGAEAFAIDHQGRLREFGSIPYPFNSSLPEPLDMMFQVAQEARYIHFEQGLDERLAAEEAADDVTVVPLYEGVWAEDPGWSGLRSWVEVELPDAQTMAGFDRLEIDARMSCGEDNRKAQCPPWDYLVHLYVCEKDDTEACGTELGRWITPYWSGGRWVTDASPLLSLLSEGGSYRFGFWTVQRYKLDIDLRLSRSGEGPTPRRSVELLRGGAFWNDYNSRYHPMEFAVPAWAEKVELVAVITGHGFGKDAANCAEFCNHTHHFSVNGGREHVKEHPIAETLFGCVDQVPDGVVPNQAGTWVYGRAGWCPGLEVQPWVIDITDEVRAGEVNELTYRGLFRGQDYVPEPADPANPEPYDARIDMRSYLVYSAASDEPGGPVEPPRPRIPGTIYLPALINGPGE